MKSSQGLHLKTLILILIMISVAPLGDTFLGKGTKLLPPMTSWAPADLFHFFFRAFTSGTIWIGIGLLLAYFVAYLLVLTWADYSYVQPASSASYVFIALLAHFMLHEDISPVRWIGVAVICSGVFIVGYTHPQGAEPLPLITQLILYISIVFIGTAGEMCVSRAMKTIGEVTDFRPHAIARAIGRGMKVQWMWIGIFLMAVAFFSLLGMLSIAKVSFVFPATALSYAVGALGGKLFLGERVTPRRWAGVLLVCIGVTLVVIGKG